MSSLFKGHIFACVIFDDIPLDYILAFKVPKIASHYLYCVHLLAMLMPECSNG